MLYNKIYPEVYGRKYDIDVCMSIIKEREINDISQCFKGKNEGVSLVSGANYFDCGSSLYIFYSD